ncbi:MAG: response regulator [Pseudomonadota bacterium]|nr:response regulator [Pseudomonadota bacterium]
MTVVQEQMKNGITVADDDDLLRKNIVEILVEAGYSLRAASTGAEAQEQYEAEPANLVIFDISMPDIDGLELVRAFFDAGENIRLMAMSGHFGDVDYLEIPNALGVAHTLRKPFRKMEILNTVETYLSQSSRSSADIWTADKANARLLQSGPVASLDVSIPINRRSVRV